MNKMLSNGYKSEFRDSGSFMRLLQRNMCFCVPNRARYAFFCPKNGISEEFVFYCAKTKNRRRFVFDY